MAVLTEEQSMLRDAARTWTQEKSPVTAFRKMRDSGAELGYDPAAFAVRKPYGAWWPKRSWPPLTWSPRCLSLRR